MGVSSAVRLEVAAGVGIITLDRPPVNALCTATQAALHEAADEAADREDIRSVVLHGSGTMFSAGADIREMAAMSPQDMAEQAPRLQAAFEAVAGIPKPVVAAINGHALGGGCELALAADHRVCATGIRIGLPEILLGVIPGAGGTQRLSRLLGPAKAKDMIFTGKALSSDEALRCGLVDLLVPGSEVLDTALGWASQFTQGPARALAAAKLAIDGGSGLPLADALRHETELFTALFATEDRVLGMTSFVSRGAGHAEFIGK